MPSRLLIDAECNRLVRSGSPVEIFDSKARGLSLRVRGVDVGSWCFVYRLAGQRVKERVTLGRYNELSLADARAMVVGHRGRMSREPGWSPRTEEKLRRLQERADRETNDRRITVAMLCDLWIERYAKRHRRSWAEDRRSLLSDFAPALGDRPIEELQRREIVDVIETVAARAPISGNRLLGRVKCVFAWAVGTGLLEANTAYPLKKPAPEQSRSRTLTTKEIQIFWRAMANAPMSPSSRRILRLALLCGQRIGEIAGMLMCEIDFNRNLWTLPPTRTKNGRAHVVPLGEMVKGIIVEAIAASNGSRFVFPSPAVGRAIDRHALSRALRKAQPTFAFEEPFTCHDLRRTCASGLASLGVDRVVIGKLLNHVSLDRLTVTGSVYDRHDYLSEKRAAFQLWEQHLSATLEVDAIRLESTHGR